MISEKIGDLLENVTSGYIVHGCNAQGVMGSGFALAIKLKYYSVYYAYREEWENSNKDRNGFVVSEPELKLGNVIAVPVTNDLVIVNAITQRYYFGHPESPPDGRRHTDYEAVARCMEQINELPILYPTVRKELHFPLIGCDRGGANWDVVSSIIDVSVPNMGKTLWLLPQT